MNNLSMAPQWPAPAAVCAAFSLRTGGVSEGAFGALNLGAHVGDASAAVAENRRLLRAALQLPAEPRWLQQVHGIGVLDADRAAATDEPAPLADAAVTRRAGTVLAVMVADCLPVMFCSNDGEVIAVAHAGWRGLSAGVLEATVAAMQRRAQDLCAWLGPCIGTDHFEVGAEVRAAFIAQHASAAAAFAPNARGRWQCDLNLLAGQRLAALGVRNVTRSGLCTHADARRFYSHRRDGQTGRMVALLWLRP